MSTTVSFTGASLSLQSVQALSTTRVRVRFTSDPRQSNPAGANDGLNPANYSLSGPAPTAVQSVAVVSGDPQALDLSTQELAPGAWNLTAANIQTVSGAGLVAPVTLPFSVSASTDATELTAGHESDDPESVIRKHFSRAMAGSNWDALIAGVSRGDAINEANLRSAYDQLFGSSAGGKYLDVVLNNRGIRRPTDVGMSDEVFRRLGIALNSKVTHEAIRQVLEIFYGVDAMRAWSQTQETEPYNLSDGQTLFLSLDGSGPVLATFRSENFRNIAQASSVEVAAVLTKAMRDAGFDSYAISFYDPNLGETVVRLYSGSLGLKSFVRVTGGTAQPFLRFPSYIETYGGTVTTGSGYTWVYTSPTASSTRISLTTTGVPLVDIGSVEEGDYVVIGEGVGTITPGSYQVSQVGTSWSGANYTQFFDLATNLGFTGSILQNANDNYRFFRPTRRTTLDGLRSAAVTQDGSRINVRIPATSQVVDRTPSNGSYLRGQEPLDIKRFWRGSDGILHVTATVPFTSVPAAGSKVTIAGAVSVASRPWVSQGDPSSYPSVGSTDGSFGTTWSGIQGPPVSATELCSGVLLPSGDLLLTGGQTMAASVPSDSSNCNRLRLVGTQTVTDASEADGAQRRTYQWISTSSMALARSWHGISVLPDGRAMVTGGVSPAGVHTATAEIYDSVSDTWTSANSMAFGRARHRQVQMADGRTMVIGGSALAGTAWGNYEIYDPNTLSWTTGALPEPRWGHGAITLSDGRIMVTGGATLGRQYEGEPLASTLVYWPLEESGTALADAGLVYPLTATGASSQTEGKVGYGRLCNNDTINGASDGAAVTALLGEWTTQFWLPSPVAPASNAAVVAHGSTGADGTAANNTLMLVGITTGGMVWWKWEAGAGVDETHTQSLGSPVTAYSRGAFVSLRKKATNTPGVYDVSLFINGDLIQTWAGINNASDGSAGSWYLNTDPDTGNHYGGIIDEVRVTKTARTDLEIRNDALRGAGWATDTRGSASFVGGQVLSSTIFYDPTTGTWLQGPPMGYGRALHSMSLLPDGRVLVAGGCGRRPEEPLPAANQAYLYWPNTGLASAEVWDPATNRWYPYQSLPQAMADFQAEFLSANTLWLQGPRGLSSVDYLTGATVAPDDSTPFFLDVASNTWKRHFLKNSAHRDRLHALASGVLAATGGDNTITNYGSVDLLVQGADAIGHDDINGDHEVLTADSNGFTVKTSSSSFASSTGDPLGGGYLFSSSDPVYLPRNQYEYSVSIGTRSSGVTSLTLNPSAGTTAGLSVGQEVYVNINGNVGLTSGWKTITALTDFDVSYLDPGPDLVTNLTGAIDIDYNTEATFELGAARDETEAGPFAYDVDEGLMTAGPSAALTTAVLESQQVASLTVDSNAVFPDGVGYLVLSFGNSNQSRVVKYLEKVGTNIILLEYGYAAEFNFPVGTTVTWLSQLGPEAGAPDSGNLYATASPAGRLAAEKTVRDIAAAGFDLNFDVVYPGDRGLGGEGLPTQDADRLSDIVEVYGGEE